MFATNERSHLVHICYRYTSGHSSDATLCGVVNGYYYGKLIATNAKNRFCRSCFKQLAPEDKQFYVRAFNELTMIALNTGVYERKLKCLQKRYEYDKRFFDPKVLRDFTELVEYLKSDEYKPLAVE